MTLMDKIYSLNELRGDLTEGCGGGEGMLATVWFITFSPLLYYLKTFG
jgi:hypothetical protein